MNSSAQISITDKGREEVALRTYRLGLKKRTVLIQVATPKTLETLRKNNVFPTAEFDGILKNLVDENFIEISDSKESIAPKTTAEIPAPDKIAKPQLNPFHFASKL